jgi:isoleucyl-tRNA synthetase
MVNVKEVYRKIRNTARFLLSNLYDFDINKDVVKPSELMMIDAYALQKLCILNQDILTAYQEMDFNKIFHMLADYSAVELSAFYLDIIKDRLYVEQADGFKRRSAQTVCWYILDTLTRLMAPILSFTAEQISDNYQQNKEKSIHLQEFARLDQLDFGSDADHEKLWDQLKQVRSAILKAIEQLREQGIIKHSLEARVSIFVDNNQAGFNWLQKCYEQLGRQHTKDFFKEFLIVSQFELSDSENNLEKTSIDGLYVLIEQAQGKKCARCWQWQLGDDMSDLCQRCFDIVNR